MDRCQSFARKILGMMGNKDFDLDAYAATDSFHGICENLSPMVNYPKEDSLEAVAYWWDRGLKKELHETENLDTKWASYLPRSYVEGTTSKKTFPLLFVLHGNANSIYLAECYGYTQLAAQEELILIIPENETPKKIDALFAYAREHYPVDWSRVYMVGYSMGGMMTSRHAIRWPERFAAVGIGGMLLANGSVMDLWYHSAKWAGETFAEKAFSHAAQVQIPMCCCMGTREFIDLLPVTREGGSPRPAPDETDAQGHPTPWLDMSSSNKIASINNWRRVAGCAVVPEATVRDAADNSGDPVTRVLGFPFEKTQVESFEGQKQFVGDCVNSQGEILARFVAMENAAHWPCNGLVRQTWNFLKQFARDPETKELIWCNITR